MAMAPLSSSSPNAVGFADGSGSLPKRRVKRIRTNAIAPLINSVQQVGTNAPDAHKPL